MKKLVENIKSKILNWLFGTDNVLRYTELLERNIQSGKEYCNLIEDYIKELEQHKEDLNTMRKLLRVCNNHEIDVDEEIKHIKL
jgi:hypothetical protein